MPSPLSRKRGGICKQKSILPRVQSSSRKRNIHHTKENHHYQGRIELSLVSINWATILKWKHSNNRPVNHPKWIYMGIIEIYLWSKLRGLEFGKSQRWCWFSEFGSSTYDAFSMIYTTVFGQMRVVIGLPHPRRKLFFSLRSFHWAIVHLNGPNIPHMFKWQPCQQHNSNMGS